MQMPDRFCIDKSCQKFLPVLTTLKAFIKLSKLSIYVGHPLCIVFANRAVLNVTNVDGRDTLLVTVWMESQAAAAVEETRTLGAGDVSFNVNFASCPIAGRCQLDNVIG